MEKVKLGPFSAGKPTVSVIIPTFNEAKNLPLVLPYIPLDAVDEVILVDGRSTDHTVEVARELLPSIKVIMERKPGKGKALRRGYAESTGDILVVIDADGSHDPREIPRFIKPLLEGADFVKGSRFAPSGGTTDMPRLRMYGNLGLTWLVNLLFAQSFTDLCYGFHAFWRYCLDYLNLDAIDGFELDTAIYLQAVRNKLKVVDIPSFEGIRFYGEGKLKTFPDGWRVLRTILREWLNRDQKTVPKPQVGFRSNILRSVTSSSNDFVPLSGDLMPVTSTLATARHFVEQKPFHLRDVFSTYLKEVPRDDIECFIVAVLLEAMERFAASGSCLIVADDELKYHNVFRVFGRSPDVVPENQMSAIMQENNPASWSIHNRKPVLIQDTTLDSHWISELWESEEAVSLSAVVIPFVRDDQVVSVMILTRPSERCFSEEELNIIPETTIFLKALA